MAIRKGDYEVAEGTKEIKPLCKKYGLRFVHTWLDGEFYSPDVTINGEHIPDQVEIWRGIPVTRGIELEEALERWKGISEEVPGLRCPYCDSQAFKTDHPNIAVCGAAPGWFMFYRRVDFDVDAKKKLVLRNGELVEETDQNKEAGTY